MRLPLICALLVLLSRGALADPHLDGLGQDAVTNLSRYLQIDTTNPPGNELAGAKFLQSLLEREHIPCTIYQSEPGRANLYAVLKGTDPSLGSLMLLSHIDVVPADKRYWKQPPFSGQILGGEIWGRGAIDMKSMGIAEVEAFIAAKRSGPLKRDLVLLAVADEEMGADAGIKWMLAHHPELFQNIAGVLNEEGPGHVENGRVQYWEVRPGQKALVWLKLVARGTPGHGSLPFAEAAPNRLVRALGRILAYQTPLQVLPEAQQFFSRLAELETGPRAQQLRHLADSLQDAEFYRWFTSNRAYNAMVRNTISITQLEGSNKTNVIPPQASAALDCRLLPGQNTQAFIEELRRVIDDPQVSIEPLDVEASVPASTVRTPLFDVIAKVIHEHFPQTLVLTPYSRAANDSRFLQERNIICYGFVPFALTAEEYSGMHGNDERISVENMKRGVRMLYEVVDRFCR